MGTGGVFLRKLRAKVDDRPTGFVWVENRSLAASGYPASRAQVAWLAKNGIGSILSLTDEALPAEWIEGLGLNSAHIPMKDHQMPSLDSMEEGVRFIEAQKEEGKAVVVHCLGGEGRTGCVLAAYLIKDKGLEPTEALRRLREIKPLFVERIQEKAVFEYAGTKR